MKIDVGRGDVANYDTRISIYELHALEADGPFPKRQSDLYEAARNAEKLQGLFESLCEILRECGSRFFRNDPELWRDVRALRDGRAAKVSYEATSKEAEAAFKAQTWAEAISLLESLGSRATKLQQGRLNYARNKLHTS